VMNIMHDVAHRIKAETQLKELNTALAEKYKQLEKLSDELTTFTSITTHNIKEPLKFIYTSLELLVQAEGRHLSDSSKANLRRMQVSLNRINRLIDDIVELFKINAGTQPIIPVNLNDVLEKVKQQLQRKISERNVSIQTNGLPTVGGIAEMLQLMFVHLIDNAIKFQPEGKSPEIEITASEVRIDEVTRMPNPNGALYTRISFRDNGIGIPADSKDRVFVMFEQLHEKKKYPGSGLGLAFCQKIMDTHEGYIELESVEGQGSIFHCYFPFRAVIN
ncbi:MAG: HAMP domain-containing histidine kinase, partial [Chitinophagaceae bacterium]